MLASGEVGLLTGDRRSSDRLSFCCQEKEAANKLSDHPLVSWRLGGSLGWVCGYVLICVICGQLSVSLCLCRFSVNENPVLWTFQQLIGYC